jgi:hypothetical protein
MKKFILLILSSLFISTSVFADETNCRVWGTDAVATINNPVDELYQRGSGIGVFAKVEITEAQTKDVGVVVNVYSAIDNKLIVSEVVRISKGSTSGSSFIVCRGGKVGDVVYIRLARASCQ